MKGSNTAISILRFAILVVVLIVAIFAFKKLLEGGTVAQISSPLPQPDLLRMIGQ